MATKKRKLCDEIEDVQPKKRRKLCVDDGKSIKMYNKYYAERKYELLELWKSLKRKYEITRVIYPGSYIQISPSFYFDFTIYIDNNKNANKFFKNKQEIKKFIKSKNEKNKFKFYFQDYNDDVDEEINSFDLLISLYAGFVTDNNLKYIKKGGYILVNNSHNDAINCYHNKKLKLIGVTNGNKNDIKDSKQILNQCFIPKKPKKVEDFKKKKHMKTIGFTKSYKYYIFQKL